jgi:hypothetical protein
VLEFGEFKKEKKSEIYIFLLEIYLLLCATSMENET